MGHRILWFVILLAASCCGAQQAQVPLTWTASASQCASDCAAGTGPTLITIYRASVTAGCTGATWAQIADGVAPDGPYVDTVPAPGKYCYEIKACFAVNCPAKLSGGSNWLLVSVSAPALTTPAAPTALKLGN